MLAEVAANFERKKEGNTRKTKVTTTLPQGTTGVYE